MWLCHYHVASPLPTISSSSQWQFPPCCWRWRQHGSLHWLGWNQQPFSFSCPSFAGVIPLLGRWMHWFSSLAEFTCFPLSPPSIFLCITFLSNCKLVGRTVLLERTIQLVPPAQGDFKLTVLRIPALWTSMQAIFDAEGFCFRFFKEAPNTAWRSSISRQQFSHLSGHTHALGSTSATSLNDPVHKKNAILAPRCTFDVLWCV